MKASRLADQDLIARDDALPGLRCILEPERLLSILQRNRPDQSMDNIQLDYVRYKPNVNCIGRFTLRINGRSRLGYTKVFGVDAAQKLAKASTRSEPGLTGTGCVTVREDALVLSWFPFDLKLNSIERLAEATARNRLIRRVFKQDHSWVDADYEVLNYKPERRLVCRFEQADGTAATVKFYTRGAFNRTAHLRRNRAFPSDLPVPRHIGGSKKHNIHAFEWLPGANLREVSLSRTAGPQLHRRAGQLLAQLHASPANGLATKEVAATGQTIREIARQLEFMLPPAGAPATDLALRLSRLATDIQRNDCPVHGDFYDKQIIVGSEGLILLDLDRSRNGTAAEDLGCFIAHLELLAILNPEVERRRVSLLAESLLEGYAECGGRYQEREQMIWTAVSLFGLSHHPFRDRVPDWPSRTHEILARTEALLAAAGTA